MTRSPIARFAVVWVVTALVTAGAFVVEGRPAFDLERIAALIGVSCAEALILSAFAASSPFSGPGLWLRLGALVVGVQIVLSLIEAYFFAQFLPDFTLRDALVGLGAHGVALFAAAFAAAWAFGSKSTAPLAEPKARGVLAWAWRAPLTAVAYVVAYFVAGSIVWFASAELREFYGQGVDLDPGKTALIQVGRGLIWAGFAWLAAEIWGRPGLVRALMTGATFSVFMSGVLLYPNPFFPDVVRLHHFFEVASSNFVFGVIAGLLMGPLARRRAKSPSE